MSFDALLDLLFPSPCAGCGLFLASGEVLCEPCLRLIRVWTTLFCGACGGRLAENRNVCHPRHPYRLGAATDYRDEAVRKVVQALKFRRAPHAAVVLGKLLISYGEKLALPWEQMLAVPVPLGARRLRQRGFNQALLLAQVFVERFRIPLAPDALIRVRETKPQSEIVHFAERAQNVADCFTTSPPESVQGKRIVLIDDVTTSGATFREAALTLKRAGARSVIALAVAKA